MPVSFMAPASAYASDPRDGSAIGEFKELVEAFHDAGLAVILASYTTTSVSPTTWPVLTGNYTFQRMQSEG